MTRAPSAVLALAVLWACACVQEGRRPGEVAPHDTVADSEVVTDATPPAETEVDGASESEVDSAPETEVDSASETEVDSVAETTLDVEDVADVQGEVIVLPTVCTSKGMTWETMRTSPSGAALMVDCSECDPVGGDTCCREALPVLCILPGTAPRPADVVVGGAFRQWSGGTVALTTPFRGDAFDTRGDVDALCATRFGAGWRVAEFHDGGGWGLWAFANGLPLAQRAWVDINDQLGNCWSWACDPSRYGDGVCDCGCKVRDADCLETNDRVECANCFYCGKDAGGSSEASCDDISPSNTRECVSDP